MNADDCVVGHTVAIYERGGTKRVSPIVNLSSITWERVKSDAATATAVVSGRNCEMQAEALASIKSHAHEMIIWRGDERVFDGVVTDISWFSNRVEVKAEDVGLYIRNTVLSRAYPADFAEFMTDRVQQIIEYEMTTPYTVDVGLSTPEQVTIPRWENLGSDPYPYAEWGGPANVLPFLDVRPSTGTGGLRTYSDTLPFQLLLGEHLSNLAEGGLDFVTVGRSVVIWDSATPLATTRPLTDADFLGDVAVIESGRDQASITHVVAQAEEDPDTGETSDPPVGSAGGADPFYGVWTDLRTREDEDASDTQYALNTQARRVLSGRQVPPVVISTPSGIRVGTGLSISDLVPGVILPVRATMNLKRVSQNQTLSKLTVTEDAGGESVSVELSPAGELTALGELPERS